MSVICEDIPDSDDVKKAIYANFSSMVRAHYIGESKIPGIDATKLAPCVLSEFYKPIADKVEALKVYEDDVWVASFPKSGSTWVQEMVWLIANNLDYDNAKKYRLIERYRLLEMSGILSGLNWFNEKNSVELTTILPRPRFIKSHLPIALLPTEIWSVKPKMVYVARNAKDVAISYYHHFYNLHRYKGTLEDFLDSFLNNLVCWSPYIDNILGYWQLRNEPNILFITYEEMSKDLQLVLRKVAKFFGKTYTDDQFNELAKHLSFNEMRVNRAVNYEALFEDIEQQYGGKRINSDFRFVRRGQVNSAKDEMPVEYQKKFDDWLAEGFKGSDFPYNSCK